MADELFVQLSHSHLPSSSRQYITHIVLAHMLHHEIITGHNISFVFSLI